MCNPARDYYHFMYYRWIPLFSSLTLTGLTGGLWGYAWESTAPAPTWVPASVLVLAFLFAAIGAIGIVFASKTTASKAAKITYLTGTMLFLAGFVSFYVFSQPTTINIFGFIAVTAGLIVANLAAGYLYRHGSRQK